MQNLVGFQYSDFSIMKARRPDLVVVVVDKKERICKITNFALPGDSRIERRKKIG